MTLINFITIDHEGKTGEVKTTKDELLSNIDTLEERDLNLLDNIYNHKISSIITKGKTILIKMDYIRCLIHNKRAYVVSQNNIKGETIIDFQLSNFYERLVKRIKKLNNKKDRQKFKLIVVEEIFSDVADYFDRQINKLSPKVAKITRRLFSNEPNAISNPNFINLQMNLVSIQLRLKNIDELFSDMLKKNNNNDEFEKNIENDDENNNSSTKKNTLNNLLKNYDIRFEDSYRDTKEMLTIIDNTIEVNQIRLDEKRNKLQVISIYISLVALGVAVSALLTGFFGMNIKNQIETSIPAFYIILGFIILIIVISLAMIKVVRNKIKENL